jgi:hypothetical protein
MIQYYFLDKETVYKTSEVSLRNAVRSVSVCGGQGFTKCGCSASGKLRCNTKRCACKKAAVHNVNAIDIRLY